MNERTQVCVRCRGNGTIMAWAHVEFPIPGSMKSGPVSPDPVTCPICNGIGVIELPPRPREETR